MLTKNTIYTWEGRKHGAFMNPRVIPTCIAFWPGEKELNLHIKHTTLEPYLFISPFFGRNFVHSLHLKWVPMFLTIYFLLLNLHVRMYVGCTVKYSFRSFSGSSNLSPKLR